MSKHLGIDKLFVVVLWLIAIHSFLVGLLLIILPTSAIVYFGFEPNDHNFFRVQGGVFHIVMSVFYIAAASDIRKHVLLIKLIITTKFIATIFLISYYVFVSSILVILLSGVGDFLIGAVILLLFYFLKKNEKDLSERSDLRD